MAKTLPDGSDRPAGQRSCITVKAAQERPEEHDEELKVSTWPLDSPDLTPPERPLDVSGAQSDPRGLQHGWNFALAESCEVFNTSAEMSYKLTFT